mgnify:CR=1 FL=1|jgi:hypothetical protein|tara:strand:- start:28 stop:186 length:159 start_codon:yes stop_codon:yes gene_type:complete
MKWFSRSYWWNLLMGDSKEEVAVVPSPVKKTPSKRGRPKGSTNKPKIRKKKK